MTQVLIKGGSVLRATGEFSKQDVLIDGRLIKQVAPSIEGITSAQTIDATGHYVLPGLVDLRARLSVSQGGDKSGIAQELKAAVKGGVTALCSSPDSVSLTDSSAAVKVIKERSTDAGLSHVLPLGAMTIGQQGEALTEYASLIEAGCVAIANGYHCLKDMATMHRCFAYAASFDCLVMLNCFDASIGSGAMHDGVVSQNLGLSGSMPISEKLVIEQAVALAELTGARLHISQVSSASSLSTIRAAKERQLPVTADVSISNLLYTDEHVGFFDTRFRVEPPLRSESDRAALLEAVVSGTIDAVVSNHQPELAAEKDQPFAESQPGISCIELLPAMAYQIAREEECRFGQLVNAMSQKPASVLGRDAGVLNADSAADLFIFDSSYETVIQKESMRSQGINTPVLGETITGQVLYTIVDGQIVYSK